MKKIQGVIFDMDGLIIDTEKWLQKYYLKSARQLGYDMKPEDVLAIRSLAREYAEPFLKERVCKDFDIDKIKELRKGYMDEHIKRYGIEKKKGIDELLAYIKANNIKCAVATATAPDRTEQYLNMIGLYDKFDKIVCATTVKHGKPQPDVYLEACACVGLPPQNCIALEDSPNGILSAYRAGCVPVMVPDLTQPDEETAKIIYAKADDLSKVIDIIEQLNA